MHHEGNCISVVGYPRVIVPILVIQVPINCVKDESHRTHSYIRVEIGKCGKGEEEGCNNVILLNRQLCYWPKKDILQNRTPIDSSAQKSLILTAGKMFKFVLKLLCKQIK